MDLSSRPTLPSNALTSDYQALVNTAYTKSLNFIKNNPKASLALGFVGLSSAYKYGPELYYKIKYAIKGTKEEKIFEYNPDFQFGKGLAKEKDKKAFIYAPGMNGIQFGLKAICQLPCFQQKCFPVTFTHRSNIGKTIGEQLLAISRTNLGGIPEAEVLLYAMKQCSEQNIPIILFGLSRGGATVIRALHMLSFPNRYMATWKKLGLMTQKNSHSTLDLDRIEKIKKSVEKVFIVSPLLKLRSALQYFVGKFIAPLAELAIHLFSSYSMCEPQPIDMLKEMSSAKEFNIDFFLTPNDNNVSPYQEKPLKTLVDTTDKKWTMEVNNSDHCDTEPAKNGLEQYLQ